MASQKIVKAGATREAEDTVLLDGNSLQQILHALMKRAGQS
ncbi:MAG TPA: hypothetical protein VFB12_23695 [Ktedonobacteraceae bacterium]|nr:hypothetical protein [Ktedonobacteraceae bacterium]